MFIANSHADETFDEKHIAVSLRMIGHQVLLNSGDSTSRVLPIIKSDDRYSIQFESEFAFMPEELVKTVNRVVAETKLATGYIVEMEKCETGEVVYSFEKNRFQHLDILPCKERSLPKSCYHLVLTLKETSWTPVGSNPATSGPSERSFTKAGQVKYVTIGISFVLLAVAFFMLWKKKNNSPSTDPNLIPLGEYRFDTLNSVLFWERQKIELSSKEADLLLLLYQSANTTLEREVLLNKVWGDQGDYVGRTLDVFISKLRKKLEADSSVKIVNIRGVGYKLVVEG
jgi:hypothetical protein